MPSPSLVGAPEEAYVRNVRIAAEILDAVTLEPVRSGLAVTASGLDGKPIVNGSGFYVWLNEGTRQPFTIVVDAEGTPYESVTKAVPPLPDRRLRIELAPRASYPFGSGITSLRGTMITRRIGPRAPLAGAEVWLRWIDHAANGTTWVDIPVHSHTNANGDFAAIVRLAPAQVPVLDASGAIRGRLGARYQGVTRTSDEFAMLQGRVYERSDPFVWNEFLLNP
jgi:hypothetical protein